MENIKTYVESCAKRAKAAAYQLSETQNETRNQALRNIANALRSHAKTIQLANEQDLIAAKNNNLSPAMLDRLALTDQRIQLMADSVDHIASQPDIVGALEEQETRPNGLQVARMRIPLGVIAIIYESRPNVTADAAALCLKSANAVILKGGKEAFHSNRAIVHIIREQLTLSHIPADAVSFIETTDRNAVNELIKQKDDVDLLIPRGGESLIRFVSDNATIPVIQHFKGVCHIFVEKTADIQKAKPILINAKCQRPGVCNAMETLLLDAALPQSSQRELLEMLAKHHVVLHADNTLYRAFSNQIPMVLATEDDWYREYLSLDLSVKCVANMDDAIQHILRYGSLHTEAILTEDRVCADQFLKKVNSSTVLVNASTRFADGGELGLGAEIGISTSKLHAFGPMGCKDLTTRKFVVIGNGQIRT